jgi:predicted TIM-barrel fold metal-dependent hydrolase
MPTDLWPEYLESEFHDSLPAFTAENDANGRAMIPLNDFMMDPAQEVFDRDGAYRERGWEGAWDAGVRLAQLDREGIAAEVVYHGFFRIADLGFSVMSASYPDEVIDAGARAHDRWALDTFGGASDRLLLVGAMGACTNLERTIDEVAWCADHGFIGTYAPGFVAMPGRLPPLDDEYWDPLWALYADRGLAVIVHGGYGLEQGVAYGAIDQALRHVETVNGDVMDLVTELSKSFNADFFHHVGHRQAFWQMLLGGVFDRHPKLKLMMTEVRADWIPALLRHLDGVFEEHRADLPTKRKPSEWWDSNGLAGVSFMHKSEVEMRDDIDVDHMNFGRDYPHAEGTWPNTVAYLQDLFHGVPEADVRKILGENLIRFLDLDAAKLDEIAARVGPTIEQITGAEKLDPALLAHLDQRCGYLKPYEGDSRIADIEELVLADVERVGAASR